MDKKRVNILDGTSEQREKTMKDFFGIDPDQSFQELDVDIEDVDEE